MERETIGIGMRQFSNETVRKYADRIEIKLREMNSAIIVKIENRVDQFTIELCIRQWL